MLDLSKIEAGKMELFLETFDVGRPGAGGRRHRRSRWWQKNANALAAAVPDDLGSMHADVTRVRQCLLNLLSNACKFTEQGHGHAGRAAPARTDGRRTGFTSASATPASA